MFRLSGLDAEEREKVNRFDRETIGEIEYRRDDRRLRAKRTYPLWENYVVCCVCGNSLLGYTWRERWGMRWIEAEGVPTCFPGENRICSDCEGSIKRKTKAISKIDRKLLDKKDRQELGDRFLAWFVHAIVFYARDNWDFRKSGWAAKSPAPEPFVFCHRFWTLKLEVALCHIDENRYCPDFLGNMRDRFVRICGQLLGHAEPEHRRRFKKILKEIE